MTNKITQADLDAADAIVEAKATQNDLELFSGGNFDSFRTQIDKMTKAINVLQNYNVSKLENELQVIGLTDAELEQTLGPLKDTLLQLRHLIKTAQPQVDAIFGQILLALYQREQKLKDLKREDEMEKEKESNDAGQEENNQ